MPPHRGSLSTGVFRMTNADCPGCAERVSRSLKNMDGVLDVGINFVTDNVYVTYDPVVLARAEVRRAIKEASDERGLGEGNPARDASSRLGRDDKGAGT